MKNGIRRNWGSGGVDHEWHDSQEEAEDALADIWMHDLLETVHTNVNYFTKTLTEAWDEVFNFIKLYEENEIEPPEDFSIEFKL
ncbi:MAG: hypothetical protein LBG69_04360 [Zoogloeaceae bacterium]|jgi:hypothetical protein|nr:hypothetical protein [Zoogloeaceae bacterium]